ncbi:metallopeptidase family protein [Candidatus Parcubacteria bacterium]|nr:MAG: metallopeptidase family protein [Candidatus Parcubacteria bacterium]
MVTPEEFEELVAEGLAAIPERFTKLLDNVAVVIEDEPSLEQRRRMRLSHRMTLFGLYEGIPHTRRGPHYFGVLPDKITIFRKPIIAAADSPDAVRAIVRDTVWHEIAHHFGMDEHRVRAAEKKRRKRDGA